jgi:hypothetical protein
VKTEEASSVVFSGIWRKRGNERIVGFIDNTVWQILSVFCIVL